MSASQKQRALDTSEIALAKMSDVLELLDCSVCLEQMSPPIYQCMNGHVLCSKCKTKMKNSCPTCRCTLGDIRCLHFEKLIAVLKLTCKYYKFGCLETFQYNYKPRHEVQCAFRPYDCPHPSSNCMASLDLAKLMIHLKNFHNCGVYEHPIEHEFQHLKPQTNETAAPKLVIYSYLGEHFGLYFESFKQHGDVVYMVFLMFMGDASEGKDFRYRLKVTNGIRKMSWEGMPRSIRDGHDEIQNSSDGLVFNSKVARLFSDDIENLRFSVTGRIWKD